MVSGTASGTGSKRAWHNAAFYHAWRQEAMSHQERFLHAIDTTGRIYGDGAFDVEYAVALYILTSDTDIWQAVQRYVGTGPMHGIDFPEILARVHFSTYERVLVQCAASLFNPSYQCNILDLIVLSERHWQTVITALSLRRKARLRLEDMSFQESRKVKDDHM